MAETSPIDQENSAPTITKPELQNTQDITRRMLRKDLRSARHALNRWYNYLPFLPATSSLENSLDKQRVEDAWITSGHNPHSMLNKASLIAEQGITQGLVMYLQYAAKKGTKGNTPDLLEGRVHVWVTALIAERAKQLEDGNTKAAQRLAEQAERYAPYFHSTSQKGYDDWNSYFALQLSGTSQ